LLVKYGQSIQHDYTYSVGGKTPGSRKGIEMLSRKFEREIAESQARNEKGTGEIRARMQAVIEMKQEMAKALRTGGLALHDVERFLTGVMFCDTNVTGISDKAAEVLRDTLKILEGIVARNELTVLQEACFYEKLEAFCFEGVDAIRNMLRGW